MADLVTINSFDHGSTVLSGADDIREFVNAQREAWNWVKEHNPGLHQHLTSLLDNVMQHVGSDRLQHIADQTFLTYRFPIATSSLAEIINAIAVDSPATAIAMLQFIVRQTAPDFTNRDHLRAVSSLVAYEQNLTQQSVEASQAAIKRTVTAFQRQESAARGRGTLYEQKLDAAEERYERVLQVARRYVTHKIRRQRQLDDERLKESLDAMEATKALYMEHMALRAPVQYWTQKAAAHGAKGSALRVLLVKFAVRGGASLVAALLVLAGISIFGIAAGVPAGVLVVLATIGVVLTTIAFWAGRILTRLYLSEVHLTIDASERATMVETYLALTSIGEATKEERAIILGSLFRPTADGIVKDDAAPDLSPASILSRLGTPG